MQYPITRPLGRISEAEKLMPKIVENFEKAKLIKNCLN